jgi:hypothetical protein
MACIPTDRWFKAPTGRVSPEQTAFLQTVVRAGGVGFVARSCDDVVQKLGLGQDAAREATRMPPTPEAGAR